ncbi:hypothetical protein Glove_117g83 [Diversispora epigaea]|uniref:Uncharacterized protein n=1 Tax=Diversispora epigaea TaxID=1348612 RepID=A0A397J7A8_9GLOM|nr:hypothetical protein Glove_117g83 [Diversispora epigaea]
MIFGYDFSMRSFRSNNFTLDNDRYCRQDGYEKPIRKSSEKHFTIVNYKYNLLNNFLSVKTNQKMHQNIHSYVYNLKPGIRQ